MVPMCSLFFFVTALPLLNDRSYNVPLIFIAPLSVLRESYSPPLQQSYLVVHKTFFLPKEPLFFSGVSAWPWMRDKIDLSSYFWVFSVVMPMRIQPSSKSLFSLAVCHCILTCCLGHCMFYQLLAYFFNSPFCNTIRFSYSVFLSVKLFSLHNNSNFQSALL